MATTAEFGRGKTIFVLAIVIGCFAVLWPKIFYPMLTASISPTNGDPVPAVVTPPPRFRKGASTSQCCDVISVKDTNAHKVMNEICTNIMKKEQMMQQQQQAQQPKYKKAPAVKVSATTLCRNEILQTCGVDITGLLKEDHSITPEYKKSLGQLRTFNTSLCIKMNYGVDFREIGLPRKIKGLGEVYSTLRQERPFRPGPDMVHPALRERGRAIPTVSIPRRTIEREARPGPVPGMRPPVGGAGHIPTGPKGGGTMGIIMPMYTIGIVCFFLYTIMKILFKKPPEAEQAKPAPQVKDYGMDPEHRKYVFSEEYTEGSERSLREPYNKEDRELGIRRRPSAGKSARFYEDRRRLESPSIIYPTYPSDHEIKDLPETESATHTSATPSITEKDMPQPSKESLETATTVTVDDTNKTDLSLPSLNSQEINLPGEKDQEPQHVSITSSLPSPSHYEPPAELHDNQSDLKQRTENIETEMPRKASETDNQPSEGSPELSRTASLASSADTVIATTGIESPPRTSSVEERGSSSEPSATPAPMEKKASVVSPSEMGPFSPLAPEQTDEEFHFFDRTIVIPDYDPVEKTEPPTTEVGQPGISTEEVDLPQITIVKQESVPKEVLEMASQVAETILDAVKSESVIASRSTEMETPAVTEPPCADEGTEIPPTSPAPPPTPATSSEPPLFPVPTVKSEVSSLLPQPQVERKDDDEANKESGHRERDAIVTAVKGIVEAFDATKTSPQSKAASPPPATKKEGKAAPEEDIEKLIASAEKPSTAATKEDLGAAATPSKTTEAQPPSSPTSVVKPALKDKREKSIEKEVKFKLPPEEMEVEEEEEIEEEEEVEIVRPPTPPKTLSKAKPKSPEPPTTPELFGTPPLASTSSHRSNHDEVLISSMQTTVAGSAADTDNPNKSPSPAALIADLYNNTTPKITSPTNTPTLSPQPPYLYAENNALNSDLPTITETVTVHKSCHDDPNGDKQSAVAAIAQAKAGMSSPTPTSGVSVIGIEETASLISGERWDMNRTPTPTFRQPTPPVPHRPPSPPDQIPSIYLEGPMPTRGQEFVVREAHVEVEGGDDYDYDDDYEPSGPVILSGKVTLSVISSAAGTALSHEDVTEAPSLSLDDRAQAERSRGKSPAGGKSATLDNASAKNQTGRGKSEVKKSSNASSPDMDEYEVIGKGGFEHEDDDSADVSLDDFLTATDAEQEGEKAQEDTAADISTMDDLKQEALPKDEE